MAVTTFIPSHLVTNPIPKGRLHPPVAAWLRRRMHESGLDGDHAPGGLLDEAGVTGRHARESHRPRVCEITGRQRNIFDKLGYGLPATS